MRSLADRLIALNDLRVRGYLTEVEFALAKARILAEEPAPAPDPGSGPVAPPPPPSPPTTLNPVVPAVGLGLGAAGGFGG